MHSLGAVLLIFLVGIVGPILLERRLKKVPELVWKMIELATIFGILLIVAFYDPVYDRLWGKKISPFWSTAFVSASTATLAGFAWWLFVVSGVKAVSSSVSSPKSPPLPTAPQIAPQEMIVPPTAKTALEPQPTSPSLADTNTAPIDWPSAVPIVRDTQLQIKAKAELEKQQREEAQKAATLVCSSAFDYAITTLRDKLKSMAMEHGDDFSSDYSGMPVVISETETLIKMRGNVNWNFNISLAGGGNISMTISYVGNDEYQRLAFLVFTPDTHTIFCIVNDYEGGTIFNKTSLIQNCRPTINEMLRQLYAVQILHIKKG